MEPGRVPKPSRALAPAGEARLAYAIMETFAGFAPPFVPHLPSPTPLASPFGDFGTCTFPTTPARFARALALGLAKPSRALASAG